MSRRTKSVVGGLVLAALIALTFVAGPAILRAGGLFFLTLTALTGRVRRFERHGEERAGG